MRSSSLVVAGLLLMTVIGVLAPRAHAGSYDVWSCRDPLGAPGFSTGAWFVDLQTHYGPTDGFEAADTCAADGALSIAMRSGRDHQTSSGLLRFMAPAGTVITDYVLQRNHTMTDTVSGYQAGVEEVAAVPGFNTRMCWSEDAGWCPTFSTLPMDPANVARKVRGDADAVGFVRYADPAWADLGSLQGLRLFARCQPPNASTPCLSSPTAPATTRLFRSMVTLEDPTPPVVTSVSGPLVDGTSVTGVQTLLVGASDPQSGIASVTLSVDGGGATIVDSGASNPDCRVPYSRPQPCPSSTERVFSVDTAGLVPGAHSVAGTVTDAAGNATAWGPVVFAVAEPPAPAPIPAPQPPPTPAPAPPTPTNGSPAVVQPKVTLDSSKPKRGKRPRISGRVTTAAGTPVRKAEIVLYRQTLGVSGTTAERHLKTVRTGSDGRFALAKGPEGANRIIATFVPWKGAAPTVRVTRRAHTGIAVSRKARPTRLRNGGRLTLSGRLSGAGDSARGAVVRIDAIVRGRYRAVGTVRADKRGRWRWRYRFNGVTRPTRFSFRATVASSPAWPWGTHRSKRVRVRVDPR
ncbi:MAG: hypothetical protein AB7G37_09170 [Solirubrobacteraceae bacterium]